MAKITGLSGMIQGKVGPTVYRVSRGVQIASQYNPNPANPRSPAQTDQRSIFGSAVKLAKAVYDDEVLGPLFKSVQYKQRTNLISNILSDAKSVIYEVDKPPIITTASLKSNWVPGFGYCSITGEVDTNNLKINVSPAANGALPSIAGAIVFCLSRPLPNWTLDDITVSGVGQSYNAQGIVSWFDTVVPPGGLDALEIPFSDMLYVANDGVNFIMPQMDAGLGLFSITNSPGVTRCFYVIPLSYDYDGYGLRMVVDGREVTVGDLQFVYSA